MPPFSFFSQAVMRRTQDIRTSHAPRRARMHARLCTIRACICMRPPVVGIAPAPFWGPRPKPRFWVPGAVGRSDDGHWPFAAFREPHHHNIREGSFRHKVFSDVYSDMIMVNTTPRNWVGFVRVFALAEGDHSTLGTFQFFFGWRSLDAARMGKDGGTQAVLGTS